MTSPGERWPALAADGPGCRCPRDARSREEFGRGGDLTCRDAPRPRAESSRARGDVLDVTVSSA